MKLKFNSDMGGAYFISEQGKHTPTRSFYANDLNTGKLLICVVTDGEMSDMGASWAIKKVSFLDCETLEPLYTGYYGDEKVHIEIGDACVKDK